jgi:hypothetical protein
MNWALLYLQACSFANRARSRLRRLKQPKYLAGAIVGGAYFYFYFFRFMFGSRQSPAAALPLPLDPALVQSLAALVLLVVLLFSWLIPHGRAALTFSEAEIAFLFPAPLGRRGLIHYKLLRSQFAILFTTLFLTLFSGRWRAGGQIWITILGWWIILATLNLHFLAASFARTWLLERGITNWQRRLAVLGPVMLAGLGIALWARHSLPPLQPADRDSPEAFVGYVKDVLVAGPLPWLLSPLRLVVRPFLAANVGAFLLALGPALLVLALHYLWVMRANVSFEEASVALSQRIAERLAAVRAGQGAASLKPAKARRNPFRLAATGAVPAAFLWKNLIAAGQMFTARLFIVILASTVIPAVMIASTARHSPGLMIVGAICFGLLCMSLLSGPQMLRYDLRQDLMVADILKVYPLRGWQVVLGELLAPVAILTAVQWLLIALVVTFFALPDNALPLARRLVLGVGVAILAPALDFVSLLIPNAAALLFPGWMPLGRQAGPRGIETMGQGLILLLGQVLVFTVALLPAALVAAVILLAAHYLAHWAVGVPFAALAAAVVLGAEGALGVWLLGRLFERLDLSVDLNR